MKKNFSSSQIPLLPLSINPSHTASRRKLLASIQIKASSLSPEKSKQVSSSNQLTKGTSDILSQPIHRSNSKSIITISSKSPNKLAPLKNNARINQPQKISTSRVTQSDPISSIINSLFYKSVAGCSYGRVKKKNQDSFFVISNFNSSKSQSLLGVLDGHGTYGGQVSSYIRSHLPSLIESRIYSDLRSNSSSPLDSTEIENLKFSLTECYTKINQDLNTKSGIDTDFSGSTSVTVFIRGRQILCSNIGDSRAIIGRVTRTGWISIPLSRDHKPDQPDEKLRIEKNNGRVESYKDILGNPLGPPRVWIKNEQVPGLAMSRSIGDKMAAQAGVICTPEIFYHWVENTDKFIIIASDGIWEFISSEECVKIVSAFYFNGRINEACEQLISIATHRWNKEDGNVDDITVIIALIKVKEE